MQAAPSGPGSWPWKVHSALLSVSLRPLTDRTFTVQHTSPYTAPPNHNAGGTAMGGLGRQQALDHVVLEYLTQASKQGLPIAGGMGIKWHHHKAEEATHYLSLAQYMWRFQLFSLTFKALKHLIVRGRRHNILMMVWGNWGALLRETWELCFG